MKKNGKSVRKSVLKDFSSAHRVAQVASAEKKNPLKEFRAARHLSVAQISRCIGYSAGTLYRWERSFFVPSHAVSKYEQAFNQIRKEGNKS